MCSAAKNLKSKVPHIVTLCSKCNRALTLSEFCSGITDAAFTRTDYLESFLAKDPVNGARLRILNPVTPPPILDGEPFPFQTTSELYPEYGLLAGKHVEWELQREVLTALLKLNKNDTVQKEEFKKKEFQREVLSAL
jgi:ABC-type phosphate/phosphonate transport system substrate-binding protein